MKKYAIFPLLLLMAGTMKAEQRSFDEAQAIAQQFLSQQAGQPVEIHTMRRAARNGAAADAAMQPFYAFNDSQNDAFVIVSGSTLTRPVLAHGMGQMVTDIDEEMPDGLRWWLNAVSERTAYLEQHPEAAETSVQLNASTTAVAPLLDGIEWDQTGYYALMTPTISGEHCPTGCAATAMAQIIRYYKAPTQGQGSYSYTWKYTENGISKSKTLSVDFSAQTYDYSLMPKTFRSASGLTTAQKNEVSKLGYHCGVAIQMEYAVEGSGAATSMIDRALVENFGYNSRITCLNRDCYSYEEWVALMQDELKAGRPVLYGGMSPSDYSGHGFILEGYDSDGLFYVNWGWNGYFNAYFDIAILNPGGAGTGAIEMVDGFCENQQAIVNISPYEGVGDYHSPLAVGYKNKFSSSKSATTKGSTINIQVNSIVNQSSRNAVGECGIVLMKNGTMVNKTSLTSLSIKGCSDSYAYYNDLNKSYTIPSDLTDGTYQAYLYFQPSGSSEWDIIHMSRATYQSYLEFVVSGNNVTISRPKVDRTLTTSNWSFEKTNPSTRTEYLTAELTNNTSESIVGEYYLALTYPDKSAVDKAVEANQCLTINPGETITATFVYTFTQSGEWTSKLYYKPWNSNDTIARLVDGSARTFQVDMNYLAGAEFTLNEAPTITSKSEDGKFYRNSPVTATFNVSNTGIDYKGSFAIWLYKKNTTPSSLTPVGQYEGAVSVANDGSAHDVCIDFNLNLDDLSRNVSYFARPYYYNGDDWVLLDNNLYTKINIYGKDDPAGIAEVMIDEPKNDLRSALVFNVLGKRVVVPESGQLPKGIYIVNGRKMVIR